MKKIRFIGILAMLVAIAVRCTKNETSVPSVTALPATVTSPVDNPLTASKAALGKLLFWDPILSANRDVACATCHHPSLGSGDGIDLSIGVNGQGLGTGRHFISPGSIPFAKRNAQSVINAAFNGMHTDGSYDPATAAMFFDNRTHSLELQSLEPIKTLEEMRGTNIPAAVILDSVVARIKHFPAYVQLFQEAFPADGPVNVQNIGKAIASFERTIISNHSPYDEFSRGNTGALSNTQIQGMNAFTTNGCATCHSGPMFSDYSLHVLSVPDNAKGPTDAGANGSYAFRTPSLRNLSLTAPYMHNGSFSTLDQVMDFYDRIGDRRSQNSHVAAGQLDGNLRALRGADRTAIIQFLLALEDHSFDKSVPPTVPSGLHPGGNL
jgi:cytochrome c peroxidase